MSVGSTSGVCVISVVVVSMYEQKENRLLDSFCRILNRLTILRVCNTCFSPAPADVGTRNLTKSPDDAGLDVWFILCLGCIQPVLICCRPFEGLRKIELLQSPANVCIYSRFIHSDFAVTWICFDKSWLGVFNGK